MGPHRTSKILPGRKGEGQPRQRELQSEKQGSLDAVWPVQGRRVALWDGR